MLKLRGQIKSCCTWTALWVCALTRWGCSAGAVNLHEVTDLTVFLQTQPADLHLLTHGGCRLCEREAAPGVAVLDPRSFLCSGLDSVCCWWLEWILSVELAAERPPHCHNCNNVSQHVWTTRWGNRSRFQPIGSCYLLGSFFIRVITNSAAFMMFYGVCSR